MTIIKENFRPGTDLLDDYAYKTGLEIRRTERNIRNTRLFERVT